MDGDPRAGPPPPALRRPALPPAAVATPSVLAEGVVVCGVGALGEGVCVGECVDVCGEGSANSFDGVCADGSGRNVCRAGSRAWMGMSHDVPTEK